ncbi:MAG: hypothetical protein HYR88_13245 [Verrucomicrobia bacterium]|nr:hypothetical protein [Verrucomicrobiota bacterium]MBI3867267.1 hypothetical protein [Verrucomicrobiota bacterium]
MKIRFHAFNTYFLCVLLASVADTAIALEETGKPAAAVASDKPADKPDDKAAAKKKKSRKKVVSTVRVHLEATRDGTDRIVTVQVLRSSPISVSVDREPVVTEAYLADAKVVSTIGGPEIELQFNSMGRTLLENSTAANRGRRLVIYSDFDKEHRWLAAPVITRLISDGVLRFTPDATPAEMERIVDGLLTIAEIKKKADKF